MLNSGSSEVEIVEDGEPPTRSGEGFSLGLSETKLMGMFDQYLNVYRLHPPPAQPLGKIVIGPGESEPFAICKSGFLTEDEIRLVRALRSGSIPRV